MKTRLLFALSAALLWAAAARAQDTPRPVEAPEPPVAFATTFFGDGNFLGVHPEDVTRGNASRYNVSGEPRGVGVRSVVKGSPAERAGLREGDVIIRFDGETVTNTRKLNRLIAEAPAEHRARLTVLRGGAEQEVTAALGKQEGLAGATNLYGLPEPGVARQLAEELMKNSEEWRMRGDELGKRLEELQRAYPGSLFAGGARRIGVSVNPLSKQLADYFGVQNGVLVGTVEPGSPAERAGLKAGDVITEADGEKIADSGDLTRVINRKQEGEVALTVVRERKTLTVRATPEKREPTFANPGRFRLVTPRAAVVAPAAPRAPRTRVAPPRVLTWRSGRAI